MKKFTLLTTAALLTAACLGSAPLTTEAATLKGTHIIISSQNRNEFGNCNLGSLLEQILQCLPSQRPCPPVQNPETELPDIELPNPPAPETPELPNTPEVEVPENNTNLSYVEQIVALVNAERAKEGLSPLTVNTQVQSAAQIRAVECELSFSHTRPNGSNFASALKEQNVSYRRAGENIAWGQRSPEEVVNAWMNSAGHRANIMNPSFTQIGVGYYQNAKGVNYWSQLFID